MRLFLRGCNFLLNCAVRLNRRLDNVFSHDCSWCHRFINHLFFPFVFSCNLLNTFYFSKKKKNAGRQIWNFLQRGHILQFLKVSVITLVAVPFLVSFICSDSEDPLSSVTANTSNSSKSFGRGKTCRNSFSQLGSLTLKSVLSLETHWFQFDPVTPHSC